MIASEERTQERFPYNNWQDNRDNRGQDNRGNQRGQPSRKQGPDNTLAFINKPKKSNKPKKFEDLGGLPCPFHKGARHTMDQC